MEKLTKVKKSFGIVYKIRVNRVRVMHVIHVICITKFIILPFKFKVKIEKRKVGID